MLNSILKRTGYLILVFILTVIFFLTAIQVAIAKTATREDKPSIKQETSQYDQEEMQIHDIDNDIEPFSETKTAIELPHAEVIKVSSDPLETKISYYVLQQSINSAIKDISTQINVPVVIASNVKGKVAAGKYTGTARELLSAMVADMNLHWYYDGRTIHVTNVQDAVMHVVQLSTYSIETLMQALKMIKLDTREFPLRHDPDNNMVIVYGPPKYVATIEVVANHLAVRARYKPEVIRG